MNQQHVADKHVQQAANGILTQPQDLWCFPLMIVHMQPVTGGRVCTACVPVHALHVYQFVHCMCTSPCIACAEYTYTCTWGAPLTLLWGAPAETQAFSAVASTEGSGA